MEQPQDILDIKPTPPAGGGFAAPQPPSEVEAARARIAALDEGGPGVYARPGETVRLNHQPQPLPKPAPPTLQRPNLAPAGLPVSAAMAQPFSPAAAANHPKKAKPSKTVPSPVKPILSAIGSFIFLLLIFKSQVLFSQLKYLTTKPQTATTAQVASAEVVGPDPLIAIPKINVNAPVVYEPSTSEAAIQKSLQNGVVHYGNTPVPGQNGNLVIVGHSSNDWWEPGNYKFVFVLLDKLVPGDQFSINYQSHRYTYKVTDVKVVEPTDLSVLAPTPGPTATLITCTPPGTSWKRLVVKADQISPTPGQATTAVADKTTPADQPVQLPGNAPSLTSQLGQAWQNMVRGVKGLFGHNSPTVTQAPSATPAPTSNGQGQTALPAAK